MPIHAKIIDFIKNNQIKKLDLIDHAINNDDLKLLASLLENNTSMRFLELPCQEITEEVCDSFFQRIKNNTSLEILRFREMPDFLFKPLLEILKVNTTLVEIQQVFYDYTSRSFVREALKNREIIDFLERNKALKKYELNLLAEEENLSLYDQVAALILKQIQLTAVARKLQQQLIQIQSQRPPFYEGISILMFYLTAFDSYNQSLDVHANNRMNLNRRILTLLEPNKLQGLIHFLSACQIDHEVLVQLIAKKSEIFTAFQAEVNGCISREEKLILVDNALNKASGLYQIFSYQQSYFGHYLGGLFKESNTILKLQELKAKLESVNSPPKDGLQRHF